MYKFFHTVRLFVFLTGISLFLSDCKPALIIGNLVRKENLSDGIYEGAYSKWPNKAIVKVTIKDGKIENVSIISHWSSWVGKRAEPIIPARIVDKQSTKVDAVTGATNSSRVIMNAAQDALEKAYRIP